MTKEDLTREIAQKTGFEKKVVGTTIEAFMETVRTSMTKKNNIYLRGFGTFMIKRRAEKKARNITKKTAVIIPEHFAPVFIPADAFKDKIRAKKG